MSWDQFVLQHDALMQAQAAYVAALPEWVQQWMNFMGLVFAPALPLAIWKREARVILAAVLLALAGSYVIGWFHGWNRLWSLAHVLFWPPALYLLLRWWPDMSLRPRLAGRERDWTAAFRAWCGIVIATMTVSLAFDVYDLFRYFAGQPG